LFAPFVVVLQSHIAVMRVSCSTLANADQLRDILEHRSEQAFYPHALDYSVIPLCTALAAQRNGDALMH